MKSIKIVSSRSPEKGRYIDKGVYEYVLTPEGLPAFNFRWKGIMFHGPKAQFVFPRDVVRIGLSTDDVARSQARWSGFSSGKVPGLIPSLIMGAVGAAITRTDGVKGFGVFYNNEDGKTGAFFAIASREVVMDIFRSVPEERRDPDPENKS